MCPHYPGELCGILSHLNFLQALGPYGQDEEWVGSSGLGSQL
jgi:hypothetical protein